MPLEASSISLNPMRVKRLRTTRTVVWLSSTTRTGLVRYAAMGSLAADASPVALRTGREVARFPNRKIQTRTDGCVHRGNEVAMGVASRSFRHRLCGYGSAQMLKKMITPLYESAVSARCIDGEQFGSTAHGFERRVWSPP